MDVVVLKSTPESDVEPRNGKKPFGSVTQTELNYLKHEPTEPVRVGTEPSKHGSNPGQTLPLSNTCSRVLNSINLDTTICARRSPGFEYYAFYSWFETFAQ